MDDHVRKGDRVYAPFIGWGTVTETYDTEDDQIKVTYDRWPNKPRPERERYLLEDYEIPVPDPQKEEP